MLSKILSKEECASCRFCCSFRRQSLWEVPVFTSENISAINASNNDTSNSLIPFESDGKVYAKYDLSDKYLTSDSEEEVKCPFLDINKGCILSSDEKPWDCKIWPFRVVKKESGEPFVVLTPTCPGVGKLSSSAISEFADEDFKKSLIAYAKEHPYLIKEYVEGKFIVY